MATIDILMVGMEVLLLVQVVAMEVQRAPKNAEVQKVERQATKVVTEQEVEYFLNPAILKEE